MVGPGAVGYGKARHTKTRAGKPALVIEKRTDEEKRSLPYSWVQNGYNAQNLPALHGLDHVASAPKKRLKRVKMRRESTQN